MSKLAHSNPNHTNPGERCERCLEMFDPADMSVEAWERLDMIVCPHCADEEYELIEGDGCDLTL